MFWCQDNVSYRKEEEAESIEKEGKFPSFKSMVEKTSRENYMRLVVFGRKANSNHPVVYALDWLSNAQGFKK